MARKIYLNGEIVEYDKAFLHISDLAIIRGYGVFDFFRTQNGQPFLMQGHIERFINSAEYFELPLPVSQDKLKSIIQDLLNFNHFEESGIKLLITGGYSEDGITPGTPNFFVDVQPLVLPPDSHFTQGIKLITHKYIRDFPEIKSVNYITSIRIHKQILDAGAVDVLFHYQDIISESSRSNFFLVRDNKIITSDRNILKGITRGKVLALAGPHYAIEERPTYLKEIINADEAFITGTTKKVMPVVKVDDTIVGSGKPGKVTQHLMQLFAQLEREW